MHITDMDILNATLANADISDMTVTDLRIVGEHATTVLEFHDAVNELAQTVPYDPEAFRGILVKFIAEDD